MSSQDYVYVKMCAKCAEKMPKTEKVCYCGGPITLIKIKKDEAASVDSYFHRRWLFHRRGK